MQRVLAVVPFEARPDHHYLYDDNTGMVFPSTPATVDLLKAHRAVPLDEAAASLADRHPADALAAASEFIERWETRFGAFYRSPEYRQTIEKQMLDFSRADMEALIAQQAWVQLVLVVTEDCNLRCSYCYYSDSYTLSRNRTSRQLSFETGKKAIDYFFANAAPKVASNPMRKLAINFYGGEPMMAQRTLRELVLYAKAHAPAELVFAVTTNGTMLCGDIVDFLVENGFHILVSLDGPKEDHDRNRVYSNGQGSFEKIVENLRAFNTRYPDYDHIHVSGVFDWKTDLLRVNEFHQQNADWLPPLQLASQANDNDTKYYEQFTEEDRERFRKSNEALERIYMEARLSGKPIPSFARVYFEMRIVGALLRKRQGNLPFAIFPFTNTCVPG
ncbi:MAG TPA: radical SAM protein [Thermoanaerobaculia bacterium]